MEFHIGGDEEREGDDYPMFAMSTEENIEWSQQGISTTIPPMIDGRTPWLQYEELIDDWIDLTTLDPEKHGPMLKQRLAGEAAVYKKLLDRDILSRQTEPRVPGGCAASERA